MRRVSWPASILAAAFRLELSRGGGGQFILGAFVTPILTTVVYVLIGRYTGRAEELAPFLVLGPALMGLWTTAMLGAGEVVADERGLGTLELLVAAPGSAELVIVGRVAANTVLSLIVFPEVLLVARALGVSVVVADPLQAALGLLILTASTLGVALLMSCTFVLARSTRLFQNVLGYPIYILSGVAFPIALLPSWIQPLSSLLSLTWGADVLRSATGGGAGASAPLGAMAAMAVLTVTYTLAGHWLFQRIERGIRRSGSITLG